MVVIKYSSILHTNAVFKKYTLWPTECCQDCIYSQPECTLKLSHAHAQKHTCVSMLSQERNPTTWWGFLILLPVLCFFFFFFFPPSAILQCHPAQCFFSLRCSCSPTIVTLGLSTLSLYFKTVRAVHQEEQTDKLMWAAVLCPEWPTCTGLRTRWNWLTCLRQRLWLGGEKRDEAC